MLDVLKSVRCVLLCMLEAVESILCLLEVLEVVCCMLRCIPEAVESMLYVLEAAKGVCYRCLEGVRCVPLCMLEAVEGVLSLRERLGSRDKVRLAAATPERETNIPSLLEYSAITSISRGVFSHHMDIAWSIQPSRRYRAIRCRGLLAHHTNNLEQYDP